MNYNLSQKTESLHDKRCEQLGLMLKHNQKIVNTISRGLGSEK